MTYSEVARKLRHLGYHGIRRRSGGSHRKWTSPATARATVVPERGNKDLKLGTLRAVVRLLGLD